MVLMTLYNAKKHIIADNCDGGIERIQFIPLLYSPACVPELLDRRSLSLLLALASSGIYFACIVWKLQYTYKIKNSTLIK